MRLQRAEWAAALLITLFAVALHALRLIHAGPLWRDEAGAFHLATAPTLGELIAKHESFPPPFFLILRTWVAIAGDSDGSLRLFGLAVGLGLLALLWWTVRRTAGSVPLLALALVAVNPFVLIYGDSLRGYGLGTLAIGAAFGAFARLAAEPDRRAIVGATVAALASVQLLFSNAALLLALGLAAIGVGLVRRRPRVLLAVTGIGVLTALSLLPWAGSVLATRSWSPLLAVSVGPRDVFGTMHLVTSVPVGTLGWVWGLLLLLALTPGPSPASGRGEHSEGRESGEARMFALFSIPLVVLAQWGFLEALGYMPRPWYLLPLLALVALALDVRLSGAKVLRMVRLGVAVLAVLALSIPAMGLARVRMTNVDLVAERIAAEAAPQDLVVVTPWYYGVSYLRYDRGTVPWTTVPGLADHRIHRYDLVKERMVQAEPLADVLGAVERALRSGHRVWVVGEVVIPPPGAPVPVLPPAPAAASGWQEHPYLNAWSIQLGAFLRDHSTTAGRARLPSPGPVNGYERLELLVFSGWQSPPPPPPR